MDKRAMESRRAEPVMGPGLLNKYADNLRKPWANVHFVGTETAFEWKGYMEGVVRAGERGAKEVVEALGLSRSKGFENLLRVRTPGFSLSTNLSH